MDQTVVPIFGLLTWECGGSPCSTGPHDALVPTLHLGRMELFRKHSLATAWPVSLPLCSQEAAWLPSLRRRQRLWCCTGAWRQQPSAGSRRWEGKAGLCGSGSGGTAGRKSRGNAGKTKWKPKPFAMSHSSFVAILKSHNSVKCL